MSDEEIEIEEEENLSDRQNITEVMKDNFGIYAAYVIGDRAIPDVRDGLKPVQRRLLYTAYEEGARASRKHLKSAEITGACMGHYHPHGDSYGTMVRMAQDFVMRHTLFDGQGNFGSLEDSPAASRYCVPSGTPIVLEDGTHKNIEELQIGDMVLTHRGHARPVESLLPMEHEELIRFELNSGLIIYCSPNHPLLVLRQGTPHWVRAEFISEEDELMQVVHEGDELIEADDIDPSTLTAEVDSAIALSKELVGA